MEEQLVSFETAVLAKEKGFDEECDTYVTEGNHHETDVAAFYKNSYGYVTAPTQSLLQKWLRETYNIKVFVIPNFESVNIMKDSNKIVTGYYDIYKILPYFFEAIIFVKDKNRFYSTSHETYEKALEIGLMKALNLINTK